MKVMLNRVAMMLLMAILCLLPISQIAHAEIYKWVDEKGTVHFTHDPSNIPEKYRDSMKVKEEEVFPSTSPTQRQPSTTYPEKSSVDEQRTRHLRQMKEQAGEEQSQRERAADKVYQQIKDNQNLTASQREMLIQAEILGSEKLKRDALNPNLTASQREALVNAERLKRGLDPIKFSSSSPSIPGPYVRTGGGLINTETGDFCPKVKGGYLDPKRGFIPAKD